MKKHIIKLTSTEEKKIKLILRKGNHHASVRNRAQVLHLSHKGLGDEAIKEIVGITTRAICNIRKKYCIAGLEVTIYGASRVGRPAKFDIKDEAELTALACSEPPEGRARWTLNLLKDNMKKPIGKSTVHLLLKKTNASRGRKKCGVSEK